MKIAARATTSLGKMGLGKTGLGKRGLAATNPAMRGRVTKSGTISPRPRKPSIKASFPPSFSGRFR
jgi:hypothetical protein